MWVGDVLIRADATGTDTFEVNRNLVLTDGARADSVPNLEIETGEIVGAGHASATGRFDDEQLFYLQARGIPEEQARRLVVRGFFGEIISKIAVPEVRDRLTDAIETELAVTESNPAPHPNPPRIQNRPRIESYRMSTQRQSVLDIKDLHRRRHQPGRLGEGDPQGRQPHR